MKLVLVAIPILCFLPTCHAQSRPSPSRQEAEYYVFAYAQHYQVPLALVYAIIDRESNWRACPISAKGAAGIMQLMPETARLLGVQDRCNIDQNIAGGIRYLAWLMRQFHHDLRLVSAAYYAGEGTIGRRGLDYRNRDVINYVAAIRSLYLQHDGLESENGKLAEKRDVR